MTWGSWAMVQRDREVGGIIATTIRAHRLHHGRCSCHGRGRYADDFEHKRHVAYAVFFALSDVGLLSDRAVEIAERALERDT